MTDYFAVLNQPRAAWLDPEQLREAFHAITLRAHPDTQGEETKSDAAFAQINEAYQVLREPKRRLHHLLTLAGEIPAGRASAIPRDLDALFPTVARLTREADVVLQQITSATSALSLSLVQPELLRMRGDVEQMLEQLGRLHADAEAQLRSIDQRSTAALHELYVRFSYVGRWIAELEERKLRLSA